MFVKIRTRGVFKHAVFLLALCCASAPPAAWAQTVAANVTAPVQPAATGNGALPAPARTTAPVVSANDSLAVRRDVTQPPDAISNDVYAEMFKILFAIFVLAVVIESALALIFNWRPFLTRFDGRGVRSLVAFVISWLVARSLELDLVERISEATTPGTNEPSSQLGYLLTGLVLAGGSGGVNNLFRSLGFRQINRKEEVIAKPAKTEAWLAVRLSRMNAVGPVNVLIQRAAQNPRLIGTIAGNRPPARLFAWALADQTRFPTVAGFRIAGGEHVSVILEGRDENGQVITRSWGPYTVEAGAVIDFELKL